MAVEQSDPTNEQIAQVLAEHGQKAAVWDHFNLVILTDGKKKAQCKGCGVLLTAQGNSTLRRHRDHSCLKDYLDGVQRLQDKTSLETDMGQFEDNIEENEQTMGLSTPPTTTDDDGGSSAGGVSQYGDDEELDVDELDEPTALYRLENYGTLHYNPWDGSTSNPDI